ncbi:MAG TPA: hypothetical protein VGC08_10345, partial [Pedobacter sp.]
ERCTVKFIKQAEDQQLRDYKIAPLILICFVENAFKHYNAGPAKGFINIHLELDMAVLVMRISNSYTEVHDNPLSTHVGLANTRKRLDILYPGRYELSYAGNAGIFEVFMKLQLEPFSEE